MTFQCPKTYFSVLGRKLQVETTSFTSKRLLPGRITHIMSGKRKWKTQLGATSRENIRFLPSVRELKNNVLATYEIGNQAGNGINWEIICCIDNT